MLLMEWQFALCVSLGLDDPLFLSSQQAKDWDSGQHMDLRKPYSLSAPRSCGTFSLDAWVVGKEAVSGSVRKLKTEYLSRFTLGKPTKVELRVEKKKHINIILITTVRIKPNS